MKEVWALMHNASSHDGNGIHRRLTNRFLQQADRVFTLSNPVSEALRPWNPTTLFHPLYDQHPRGPRREEARRQLGLNSGDRVHLFFGLIRPYKGLHLAIEALSQLPLHHKLILRRMLRFLGTYQPN